MQFDGYLSQPNHICCGVDTVQGICLAEQQEYRPYPVLPQCDGLPLIYWARILLAQKKRQKLFCLCNVDTTAPPWLLFDYRSVLHYPTAVNGESLAVLPSCLCRSLQIFPFGRAPELIIRICDCQSPTSGVRTFPNQLA